MKPDVINIDQEILGVTPVFSSTRVPVETLFVHLEKGIPLEEFLDDFPTVTRDQATEVLTIASKIVSSRNFKKIYENIVG
jgi:uncharacterized protein (DUF433 family)